MQQINLQLGTSLRRTAPPASPAFNSPSVEIEPDETACPGRSELTALLLSALEREKVSYCHWKSNWRIDEWLAGDGDLDLLVERRDLNVFAFVLARLGFKKALVPPRADLPGIVNFYGYDAGLRKFIHIHAHYQLVLGHDASKNYRLPIERSVLASSRLQDSIRQPSPEMELAIFIVRMTLKYSAPEYLARRATGNLGELRRNIRNEYHFLSDLIDPIRFGDTIRQILPTVDPRLLNDCGRALLLDMSAARMSRLRRKLERALESQSRTAIVRERSKRAVKAVSAAVVKMRLKTPNRKRLESGGSLVAVVGGDGSGKSTCTSDLHRWLGKRFETHLVHLGMPPKSALTIASIGGVRLQRLHAAVWGFFRGRAPESFDPFNPDINLIQRIRWLCTARDRYRLYKKLRRFASNGAIVLCDRFPTGKLSRMDAPRIERSLDGRQPTRIERFLIEKERSYYQRILPPDQLIVLRVEPEIAIERKLDEPTEHVSIRSKELWDANWSDTHAKLVDAGQPREKVIDEVRSLVWAEL